MESGCSFCHTNETWFFKNRSDTSSIKPNDLFTVFNLGCCIKQHFIKLINSYCIKLYPSLAMEMQLAANSFNLLSNFFMIHHLESLQNYCIILFSNHFSLAFLVFPLVKIISSRKTPIAINLSCHIWKSNDRLNR